MRYIVNVNFGGFVGCDKEYEVDAVDKEDARQQAIDLVLDDLEFVFEELEGEE